MTEREKFAKEYSLHAGIPVESVNFDDFGTPCIDTPYVTNVIPNTMVQSAYWGWQAATKAAVPKWIPVSERLPAYGDDCLIVAEGKSEAENLVYEFTKNKFSSDDQFVSIPDGEDYFYARNVSLWMPLPVVSDGNK